MPVLQLSALRKLDYDRLHNMSYCFHCSFASDGKHFHSVNLKHNRPSTHFKVHLTTEPFLTIHLFFFFQVYTQIFYWGGAAGWGASLALLPESCGLVTWGSSDELEKGSMHKASNASSAQKVSPTVAGAWGHAVWLVKPPLPKVLPSSWSCHPYTAWRMPSTMRFSLNMVLNSLASLKVVVLQHRLMKNTSWGRGAGVSTIHPETFSSLNTAFTIHNQTRTSKGLALPSWLIKGHKLSGKPMDTTNHET